jgi:hypothetical protein
VTSLCFTSRLEFTSFLISRTGVQVLHTELSSSASPKMVPLLSTPFARQCKRSADTHSADTVQTQCGHSADTVWTQCRHSVDTVRTQCRHSADTVRTQCRHSAHTVQTQCRHSADTVQTQCRHSAGTVQTQCRHPQCRHSSASPKIALLLSGKTNS